MDPLAGSSWSRPETVAGFVKSAPNPTLMQFADAERQRPGATRLLDLGCGAGRNAVPLARMGWTVVGTDLSRPMLQAAMQRASDEDLRARLHLVLAPMDRLPLRNDSCDLIVAHGIWNLARSGAEFRRGVREAARAAAPGAGLFVFTFSRQTLSSAAQPLTGEAFVFTEFSGEPQCFPTADQLVAELADAGFAPDPAVPLRELNRPRPGSLCAGRAPVIYEGAFRYTS